MSGLRRILPILIFNDGSTDPYTQTVSSSTRCTGASQKKKGGNGAIFNQELQVCTGNQETGQAEIRWVGAEDNFLSALFYVFENIILHRVIPEKSFFCK